MRVDYLRFRFKDYRVTCLKNPFGPFQILSETDRLKGELLPDRASDGRANVIEIA